MINPKQLIFAENASELIRHNSKGNDELVILRGLCNFLLECFFLRKTEWEGKVYFGEK
jgi:hypothetical protein